MLARMDMKSAAINMESWEIMVKDHSTWQHLLQEGIKHAENHDTCDKWREISEKPWTQYHYIIQISNVKDVMKAVIQKSVFLSPNMFQ